MKTYQWGIVGLGGIAHEFAAAFEQKNGALYAAASRTLNKAEAFAKEHQIPHAFGSYEELLADSQIDAVYIAVPNLQHYDHIKKALLAGKHVLCEKAITTDKKELSELIAIASANGLVLAEAMTIFNMPLYRELLALKNSGKLGKLKMIQAPFGSYKEPDPTNRFFDPKLGGGALLDIGTYAVSFARWFLSTTPEVVASSMVPFSTGVDEQSVTILRNPQDEMATVTLTFQAKMPKVGIVAFENGYITIEEYPRADKAVVHFNDGSTELIEAGSSSLALNYEVTNFTAAMAGEKNASLPLTEDVITILDTMKTQWR